MTRLMHSTVVGDCDTSVQRKVHVNDLYHLLHRVVLRRALALTGLYRRTGARDYRQGGVRKVRRGLRRHGSECRRLRLDPLGMDSKLLLNSVLVSETGVRLHMDRHAPVLAIRDVLQGVQGLWLQHGHPTLVRPKAREVQARHVRLHCPMAVVGIG